jgi:hypothetical protein
MAHLHPIQFARLLLAGLTMLVSVAPWGSTAHGAVPATCTELVQNGGFEDGDAGWQQASSGPYNLISDFNPRTGKLGAYLAGVNNADDRISQEITLPAGTITLSAWWSLYTTEDAGVFDQMTVSLLRPGGELLADLLTVDNTAPADVWDEIEIDLSPYANQTVVLQFAGSTDGTNISDFYLDDISVLACAPQRSYLPIIIR